MSVSWEPSAVGLQCQNSTAKGDELFTFPILLKRYESLYHRVLTWIICFNSLDTENNYVHRVKRNNRSEKRFKWTSILWLSILKVFVAYDAISVVWICCKTNLIEFIFRSCHPQMEPIYSAAPMSVCWPYDVDHVRCAKQESAILSTAHARRSYWTFYNDHPMKCPTV